MPCMSKELEALYRQADPEADETFRAYDDGPESWRIDDRGVRSVYFHKKIWVSELGEFKNDDD